MNQFTVGGGPNANAVVRWGESARQGRSAAQRVPREPVSSPRRRNTIYSRLSSKTVFPMLAALASAVLLALPSAGALAQPGGASAPPAGAPLAATHHVHGALAAHGIATWYGPGLYGHTTACGQTLTPVVVGVASRTLPCGTLVKLTYAGHAAVVPVLDRGPYGRIGAEWDLTAGAAVALGITETVRVSAHVVGATANVATLGVPLAAQAGALAGGAVAG